MQLIQNLLGEKFVIAYLVLAFYRLIKYGHIHQENEKLGFRIKEMYYPHIHIFIILLRPRTTFLIR